MRRLLRVALCLSFCGLSCARPLGTAPGDAGPEPPSDGPCAVAPPFQCCQGDELADPVCGVSGWSCPAGYDQSPPARCTPATSGCPCAGLGPVYTPATVWDRFAELAGTAIWIEGVAGTDPATVCDPSGCDPGQQCCADCYGPLALGDESRAVVPLRGSPGSLVVACHGDDCLRYCAPMLEGHRYCVRGTLEGTEQDPRLQLAPIDTSNPQAVYCPADCAPIAVRRLPCDDPSYFGGGPDVQHIGAAEYMATVASRCPDQLTAAGGLPPELEVDWNYETVVLVSGDTACTGKLTIGPATLCPDHTEVRYCIDRPPLVCDAETPFATLVAVRYSYVWPQEIVPIVRDMTEAEWNANPPCPGP